MTYIKHLKAKRRKNAIGDGYYDGRFSPMVYKDRKKERNKKLCRKKVVYD